MVLGKVNEITGNTKKLFPVKSEFIGFRLMLYNFLIKKSFLYKKFIFKFSNNFLDIPNDRNIHKYPILEEQGIIFVIISCLSSLFTC